MSTFKKLFASVAAVMVVASTVPANVFAASYSTEYQGAYDYAFGAGLTTQATIDGARLYDTATRAEAAKVFSNYATTVLGLTPDTNASCSFSDLAAIQGSDLVASVTTACQLGLMGQGTNGVFNPTGILSRAEAFAVIARMLGLGDANGTPWYANYLSALQGAGLVNDVSNPTRSIARGDLFIVLSRTEDAGTTPAVCQDPMVQLSCALGLDDCPAECSGDDNNTDNGDGEENEVKAGDLNVSLNDDTLANNSEIPQAGTVRFAAVDFEAGSSDVSLKSVEISKLGLASIQAGTKVWFEKDGVRVTGRASFTSDDKAILSFAPAFEIKKNNTETLDLYILLATPGTSNVNMQFKSTDINSTAENVDGGFTTPVLRTAVYTVLSSAFAALPGSSGTGNVTANGMELGAFKITMGSSTDTRNALFQSISLRQEGNADLENLSDIVLERDGKVVSTDYVVNGRDLILSVNDEIKDGATANYYIKAVVNNVESSTDTYQFKLRDNEDLNVIEKTTAFRATVTGATTLPAYNIQGGELTFTRDSGVALAANYAAGTPDVVLLKGTIKSNEAITLEDPTVSLNGMSGAALSTYFSTIYMNIGGSTFSYSPAGTGTSATFGGTATVNSTANVKIWGTLKDGALAGTIKVGPLSLASFASAEYVSNGYDVPSSVGTIEGVNVTVKNSTLNVTRTDGKGDQAVAAGTNDFTVLKLNLSSSQGNAVRVSKADFTVAATNNYTGTTLNLYVDGVLKSTKTVNNTGVSFTNIGQLLVDNSNSHTMEVKANFLEAFSGGSIFKLSLATSGLNAVDSLSSVEVSHATPSGATFTIGSAKATISAATAPVLKTLFASPSSNQAVFSFRVKAENDNVKLDEVHFTGTNLSGLSNFRLSTDGTANGVFASASASSATTVDFENVSATAAAIAKDATASYYLIADVSNNTTAAGVSVTLQTNVVAKATNGSNATIVASAISSPAHAIAESSPTFTKTGGANLSINFLVKAEGNQDLTLNSLDLTNQLSNYDVTSGKVSVYQGEGTSQKAGRTSVGTITGPITLSGYNTITAGQTALYRVVIEGVIGTGNGNLYRNMDLNNVVFNTTYNATDYNNVGGTLPFKTGNN